MNNPKDISEKTEDFLPITEVFAYKKGTFDNLKETPIGEYKSVPRIRFGFIEYLLPVRYS